MPGAVYVNRATFNVEISGLPTTNGRRLVAAALAPDYSLSAPAQTPIPRPGKAARQVTSDPAQMPGIIINHSPASSGRYIGSPSLAILPNGHYVASHDFFGPNANHTIKSSTLVFVSVDKGQTWQQTATFPHHPRRHLSHVSPHHRFPAFIRPGQAPVRAAVRPIKMTPPATRPSSAAGAGVERREDSDKDRKQRRSLADQR